MANTLARIVAALMVLTPAGCEHPVDDDTPGDTDVGTDPGDTDDTDVVEIIGDSETLRLAPPVAQNGLYAATSRVCADCHSNHDRADALRDGAGRGVAPFDLWRGSMMAHSARDPIFRATVAAEQHHLPDLAEAIGQTCTTCHAPLAWAEHTLDGLDAPNTQVIGADGEAGDIARDGVSCAACHLQTDAADGSRETWSGQLQYNDQREIYGPHRAPETGPMRNHIGFTPVERPGMRSSATCASCHTLQTTPADADGNLLRMKFPEQTPYVEYRSSDFLPEKGKDEAATCQGCHMPFADADGNGIKTKLARTPGGSDFPRLTEREPFARHMLLGGNAFALELIKDHRELLGSPASEAVLDVNIAATRDFLASSASVELGEAVWERGALTVPITVVNETGHKLPTGYPSRRAWLHVVVRDGGNNVVFESGGTDEAGRLRVGDLTLSSELPYAGLEPHRTRIENAADVVVWQSWMENDQGDPTSMLLRAVRYTKDTRLLPKGWAPSAEDEPLVQPVGPEDDDDFVGGSDTVVLSVQPGGEPPYTVEASVRYQSFSPRFLAELIAVETPETKALEVLLDGRPVPVETLATASIEVQAD